jgi:two-component system response regulator FlrC
MELDVRIIAVTNRDLTKMVREGTFRQDLYYRINVFPIWVPPLRERREDIAGLTEVILDRLVKKMDRPSATIRSDALKCLMQYDFPGNVRELQNLLERALILSPSGGITPDALLFDQGAAVLEANQTHPLQPGAPCDVSNITSFEGKTLAEIERQVILDTLQQVKGNRTQTSQILGISVRTLRNRIREYRGAGFQITQAGMECAA